MIDEILEKAADEKIPIDFDEENAPKAERDAMRRRKERLRSPTCS